MNVESGSSGEGILCRWQLRLAALALGWVSLLLIFGVVLLYPFLAGRFYIFCIPSLLWFLGSAFSGHRLMLLSSGTALFLSPFVTWNERLFELNAYIDFMSCLWCMSCLWFAFQMTNVIRSLARSSNYDWLVRLGDTNRKVLVFFFIAPLCALMVALGILDRSWSMILLSNLTELLVAWARITYWPFVLIAFVLFSQAKLCVSSVIACQLEIRDLYQNRNNEEKEENEHNVDCGA